MSFATITCTQCSYSASCALSMQELIDYLSENGWHFYEAEHRVICPRCVSEMIAIQSRYLPESMLACEGCGE